MFAMNGWFVDAPMGGRDDRLWIGCPSGEGGDFCRRDVENIWAAVKLTGHIAVLEEYFWRHF